MNGYKTIISELLQERKIYCKVFGIEESRTVYNPLIKHYLNKRNKLKLVTITMLN